MTTMRRLIAITVVCMFLFACTRARTTSIPNPPGLRPLQNVVQIATGYKHSCVLTNKGGVKCWGDNSTGQLGNGSTERNSLTPTDVVALSSGVSAIATGAYHTCALMNSGSVKCWGRNFDGQVGDGTAGPNNDKLIPTEVPDLSSGVSMVVAGLQHTCALTQSGGVKCWGNNDFGQLGDGTSEDRTTPIDIRDLRSGVSAIAAGANHTCALMSTGVVKCWGNNASGQVGNGTTDADILTPQSVVNLPGVSAIATGEEHTCALTNTGGVKCWGDNHFGQVGDGTSGEDNDKLTPVNVQDLSSGVKAIDAGAGHTCALLNSGSVKCWGHNGTGQLGNGATGYEPTPLLVIGLNSGVSAIAAGALHSCALLNSGGVKCWGYTELVGDGTLTVKPTAVDVVGLSSGVSAITAGWDHTCALTTTGGVKCWGGNNSDKVDPIPADVADLSSGVSAIVAGPGRTCALINRGGVKCWGSSYGPIPVALKAFAHGISDIAWGSGYACVLTSDGGVKCWGNNDWGQLGNGTSGESGNKRLSYVVGLESGVSAIAVSDDHACALTSSGGVKCWGYNAFGQLGDGTVGDSNYADRPVDVISLSSGVSAIAVGERHTCALTNSGSIKCWGGNDLGQVGDGKPRSERPNATTPVDVTGLSSEVSAIAAGGSSPAIYGGHTCVLTKTGGVKCWGNNADGQVGDGTQIAKLTPTDVIGLASDISAIATGGQHSCALTHQGGVKCWGSNALGQLGDGNAVRTAPVDVMVSGE